MPFKESFMFLYFILGLVLFHKRFELSLKLGTGAIRISKILFEIAKLLKTIICPSSVRS